MAALTLVSCDNESTVTMDSSVDVRVDTAMKSYQAQLAEASYGWLMDVETNKGFYRFWMDFADNDMVTMFTDNLDYPEYNGVPATSTYRFHAYERPVLSFDTYNYLHLICDPNDAVSGGSDNLGLKTDFEFEIDTVTDDLITLTGRINRVRAYLRRATEDEMKAVKLGALQTALRNAPSYRPKQYCYVDIDGLMVDVKMNTRSVMFLYTQGSSAQVDVVNTHTNLVTKDLEFDEPLTIGGVTINGLKYIEEGTVDGAFVTDSETPLLIQTKSSANVGLENCFGVNKYYTTMRIESSMFPSVDSSENYLAYLVNNVLSMKLLLTSGLTQFAYINAYFDTDTEGNPQFTIAPTLPSGYGLKYTYQITFNKAGDLFTINGSTLSMDSSADSFNTGSVYYLTEYLKDKTFRIEWTDVTYDVYTMGQLRATNASETAILYGALN